MCLKWANLAKIFFSSILVSTAQQQSIICYKLNFWAQNCWNWTQLDKKWQSYGKFCFTRVNFGHNFPFCSTKTTSTCTGDHSLQFLSVIRVSYNTFIRNVWINSSLNQLIRLYKLKVHFSVHHKFRPWHWKRNGRKILKRSHVYKLEPLELEIAVGSI